MIQDIHSSANSLSQKPQETINYFDREPVEILGEFLSSIESYVTKGAVDKVISGQNASAALEEINKIKDQLMLKARCVQIMKDNPNREGSDGHLIDFSTLEKYSFRYYLEESPNIFYNIPLIVVYYNKQLVYANSVYIALTGADSLQELQEWAANTREEGGIIKSELVDRAYEGEEIDKVYKFTSTLKPGEGYQYKPFKIGSTKNLKRNYAWSSYGLLNGSVRVGFDVNDETRIFDDNGESTPMNEAEEMKYMENTYSNKRGDSTPFGFVDDLKNLKVKLKTFLGESYIDAKYTKNYTSLLLYAELGDILFDKGPFIMSVWEKGKLVLSNPVYSGIAGYSIDEMRMLLASEDTVSDGGRTYKTNALTTALYLNKGNAVQVLKRVEGLTQDNPHYLDQFQMKPKFGDWENVIFDTYWTGPGSSFRIGRLAPKDKEEEDFMKRLEASIKNGGSFGIIS